MASAPTPSNHGIEPPKASPTARWAGIFLGIVSLALAVVLGREAYIVLNNDIEPGNPTSWNEWIGYILRSIAAGEFENWMLITAVVGIVLGLVFLFISVRPRTTTHCGVLLSGVASSWMRNVDVARLATATAENVPGVYRAESHAGPKGVTVTIQGDPADPAITDRTHQAVEHALAGLEGQPPVNVKLQQMGEVQ